MGTRLFRCRDEGIDRKLPGIGGVNNRQKMQHNI